MKTIIKDYIEQNKLCTEYIFEDYKEFLEVLFSNGGLVDMIVWFDYCKIENQSESLGLGGYIDNRDATFMWAETQIYESGFENKALIEILEYIEEILQKYPEHRLYPAFYLTNPKSMEKMEDYSYIWEADRDKYVLVDDELGKSIFFIKDKEIMFFLLEDEVLQDMIICKMLECGNRKYNSISELKEDVGICLLTTK